MSSREPPMLSVESDLESDLDRAQAQGQVWRPRLVSHAPAGLLRGLAAVGFVVASLSAVAWLAGGPKAEPANSGALEESLDGTMQLWYQNGENRPVAEGVTNHLWQVERMLVGASMCPAANKEIAHLREQSWPRKDAGKTPSIKKFIFINMEWDHPRRQYMEDQFRFLSSIWGEKGERLRYERLAGTSADDVKEGWGRLEPWKNKGFSKAPAPDVQGDWRTASCTYNHYRAISEIPDHGLAVITEDDVTISPQFLKLWDRLWRYVPDEWDIIRIGWFGDHQNCSQVVNAMLDVAAWQDPMGGQCAYCGAQAYIVNPKSKEKVLQRFWRSKITHADELLGAPTPFGEDPEQVPPLRSYVAWPTLAHTARDDAGDAVFNSDRLHGPKPTSGNEHLVNQLPSKLRGIPEKWQEEVLNALQEAEMRGEEYARKQDAETLRKAVAATDQARAEAWHAEHAAEKAVAELKYDKENYYMSPKYASVPPVPPQMSDRPETARFGSAGSMQTEMK